MVNKGPDLAVLDYGMGNLRSVARAWEHVGARVRLVTQPGEIGAADALIFPGQGAVMDAMALLVDTGFDRVIREWIEADRPFFGICLGLQALFEHSEEGDTKALGIFPGTVRRFRLPFGFKIPHMGWNSVQWEQRTRVDHGLDSERDQFYFVHSFCVQSDDAGLVWGSTEYGGTVFASAINRGNCFATQFHPEKSQAMGLRIYRNFLGII